ncbi:hypothetical protein HYPSUDRAFT_128059 [Hypholoma sublateritium FD-334 SS-4]|uniref:Nuclear protein DGCR14 n=1 Tax=Hypholoma sublateritium (strain FD-334 SS-4) TaxID=945553 RepID=A0A0D2QCA0_HYPSF|nr:hypothetical protein HYPSUDRAFT_128059 [Hypholoma sublateritium FD-334 SS-4]
MSDQLALTSSLPERSLNRQVVLEEEEYTEALSRIIARDFFPSLVHLDATNEYLDALRTRDPHLINASVRKLENLNFTPAVSERRRHTVAQTPSQTPFGLASDTPVHSAFGEPPLKRAKYDADMSLDEFQARYTSEDNSSFTKILDEENRVRKEKWDWAWGAQRRVEAGQTKMLERREMMLIEAPVATGVREKFVIEAPRPPAGLIQGGEAEKEVEVGSQRSEDAKGKAVIKATKAPEDEPPLDVMAPQKDTREAGVDGWKFKTRNSFMFSPDADISPYHPRPKSSAVENDPRSVSYTSTRLPEYEHRSGDSGSVSAPPSPTRSRIDAAITGTPYHPRSPKERNFGLIPNLPSPTPAELGPAALKQLVTWGTLNSTPRIISQTDDPTTPFHIPDISAREAMSHKLSDNASRSLRAKSEMFGPATRGPRFAKTPLSGKKGTMAPPTMTPRRSEAAGNLTPAARRLLHRTTLGTAASRRAEAMEQSAGWDLGSGGKDRGVDKVRWTPTPSPVTRR